MESHVAAPHTGDGTPTLTQDEAVAYHEFFRVGAQREVLLLGDPEKQVIHHVSGQKRKLCTASTGRCELCAIAPFSKDVGQKQEEAVFPAYVRPIREAEFVQRVVLIPNTGKNAAAKQLNKLLGGEFRGRLVSVVRGTHNRLEIKPIAGLPKGLPAALPPAFPVLNFILARFGLRQDPRVPVLRLPPIRCEAYQAGPGFTPRDIDLSVPAAEEQAKVRELLRQWKERDAGAAAAAEPPAAAAAGSADETVVEDRPPAPPPPAGKLLADATVEDIRVEGIKRRLNLKGDKPPPPAEAGDAVGTLIEAAAAGGTERVIPPIRRHPDGTITGPATVPFSRNGHHAGAGKGGAR